MTNDLEDAAMGGPGMLVGAAGMAMAAAGFTQAAAGYQLVDMLITPWWWADMWMWLICLSGAGLIPLGFGFTQARAWAIPAPIVSAFSAVIGFGWVVFALYYATFTMAALFGFALAGASALLGFIAVPRVIKVVRARRALMKGVG